MTADEVFLADVVADPADGAARLVYADWLEEHGRDGVAGRLRRWHEGKKPPPARPGFLDAKPVFVTPAARPWHVELWALLVEARSAQPVHWHYAGGRAVVQTTGDVAA